MEANNVIERLREEIACLRKSNEELFVTISKQDAEIKKLKAVADAELDTIHNLGEDYAKVLEEMQKVVEKAKVDAVKGLVEELKNRIIEVDVSCGYGKQVYTEVVPLIEIVNVAEEMTEGGGDI